MVDTTYLAAVVALVLGTSVEQGGTATPVERPVVEGGSVELRCDIPYVRSENFHWLRSNDGVILKRWANTQPDDFQVFHAGFRGRVSLEGPDGVNLRINNVRKEDEGSYYCQQKGADTSRDGTPQKLLVADAGPRLDSGDIAGISVGAISGIIIVIVATSTITYYCCKRRNQKRKRTRGEDDLMMTRGGPDTELLRVDIDAERKEERVTETGAVPKRADENRGPELSAEGVAPGESAAAGSPDLQEVGKWTDIFKILKVNQLAQNRQDLAKNLGLRHTEICQIEYQDLNTSGLEKLQEMLWRWQWKNKPASPNILVGALRTMGFYTLAGKVEECWQGYGIRREGEPPANTSQTHTAAVPVEGHAAQEQEEPAVPDQANSANQGGQPS